MAILSKLLSEHVIIAGINDEFNITNSTAAAHTINLTEGRYRDIVTLMAEFDTQANASTNINQTFTSSVDNTNGIVSVTSTASYTLNFDTANNGTTLQGKLGWTSDTDASSGGSNTVTSDVQHEGGFYPSEPIEADSRPNATSSTDLWSADSYQTIGRSGVIATKGGANRLEERDIVVLLDQSDLSNYSNWLVYSMTGKSFAFYHDRTVAWDGGSNEYSQYVVNVEGGFSGYFPEPVDPANKIWHRASIPMRKYVAPSA